MIVDIPVTSFSKKIIQYTFPLQHIEPRRGDLLYYLLALGALPVDDSTLTEVIHVSISRSYYSQIQDSVKHIGIKLMNIHLNQMMEFVYDILSNSNKTAKEAIRQYYDKYDLSEEDFTQESAYRRWQRYQRKKKNKKVYNSCTISQPNVLQKCNFKQDRKKYSLNDIQYFIFDFVEEYYPFFLTSRKCFSKKMYKSFIIYCYTTYTKARITDILRVLDIPRTTYFYNIRSFKNLLSQSSDLQDALNEFEYLHLML